MIILLLALHVLAAMVWVGGMFFAHQVLRPAIGALEPAIRLPIWRRVFSRFFPWVWISIGLLLASGYGMVFGQFGGFARVGLHIHLMQGTGILMMMLFAHLFFAPWRRFQAAVESTDFITAAKQLAQIRLIVGINLILGIVTIVAGATGRYWG
ncbi:MAG: CopD family protein [Aliidongia sp.]